MSGRFPYAIVHGRFQPFHHGHMAYFRWALDYGEHLVVGITNFDRGAVRKERSSLHRHTRAANPFSYWERTSMIRDALLEAGLAPSRFTIVALPIDAPERWHEYVPTDPARGVHLLRVFSAWEAEKAARLRRAGYRVETMLCDTKALSASAIRERILARDEWESLVPPAVARWIRRLDPHALAPDRLQDPAQPVGARAAHGAG
jgi:nicotinamide-nucleotide adenylyltransferase